MVRVPQTFETEEFPVTSVNSDRITRLHILDVINLETSYRFVDYLTCLTPIIYFEVIFLKASKRFSLPGHMISRNPATNRELSAKIKQMIVSSLVSPCS
jgi:hypothetical protein